MGPTTQWGSWKRAEEPLKQPWAGLGAQPGQTGRRWIRHWDECWPPFAEEWARKSCVRRKQRGAAEGREGSVALSQSPECCCLWQPQQPRSTFCCDRVFSVIDPNYKSQTTWAECVTHVSPAAAQCLKTQLPKYMWNEGHCQQRELGKCWQGAGSAWPWAPAMVQHLWQTPVPRPARIPLPRGSAALSTHIHQAPGPIKQGRQGHLLVWSFSVNLTQFDYFHRDIAKAEHQKCRKAMFTAIKDPTARQTWLPASEHSPARSLHCKGAQKPSHKPCGALCLQPTWGCFDAAHSWQHVCALCKCRVVEKVEVFVLLSNLQCSWVI